ncbi:hypothetical protein AQ490_24835 [Wenjunlia vitaminophila]|uniref:Histidine kinase/HSP90-like ATPase domain-containing protein n=1 Tax=Wenjunlia vitaminophila TaxID=76728 RepID=A0A0T6LR27_WENVI|nr:ATP-binding protein [Wenjunlia vitaminophila]KRV48502.1 hypothetical protein AQ490_24835 [Wenjunlia vitaminophila]
MNGCTSGGGEPAGDEGAPLGAMTLYPLPESVPLARRWFTKLIAPYGVTCRIDECLVMISELVTNAILHGQSDEEWQVRVEWYREGDGLRVDVHSPGHPGRVRMRPPSQEYLFGRGLHLVNELADRWAVGSSRFGGTVVSFTVADAWRL